MLRQALKPLLADSIFSIALRPHTPGMIAAIHWVTSRSCLISYQWTLHSCREDRVRDRGAKLPGALLKGRTSEKHVVAPLSR